MKKKFNLINLLFLCLLIAIFSVVPTIANVAKNNVLKNKFMGEDSSYQGVITIWNVDTFEGGSQNKSTFLVDAATNFSKSHNGLYFLVKNVTPSEMLEGFLNNSFPDMISFGHGLGGAVKQYLTVLPDNYEVRKEIVDSATDNGSLLALGYLMGGYIFASTSENIQSAGSGENESLMAVATKSGYDKKVGKNTKHIASVVVGKNDYIQSTNVLKSVLNSEKLDIHESISMYDAYLDFVSYNAGVVLFGTHRDLYKLAGRVKVGKIENVKLDYLSGYTNLVQYIGIIKKTAEEKKALASEFITFLASDECQDNSTNVSMINTIKKSYYTEGEFKTLEETLNKDLVIPNIFV